MKRKVHFYSITQTDEDNRHLETSVKQQSSINEEAAMSETIKPRKRKTLKRTVASITQADENDLMTLTMTLQYRKKMTMNIWQQMIRKMTMKMIRRMQCPQNLNMQ